MTTTLDKIKQLETKEVSGWLEEARERKANRPSDKSVKIAIRVLREIRRQKPINGMSQKKLAEALKVSPQYISKLLKGRENFSFPTVDKIEEVLGINLIEITGFNSSNLNNIQPASNEIVCRSQAQVSLKNTINMVGYAEYDYEYQPDGTNG